MDNENPANLAKGPHPLERICLRFATGPQLADARILKYGLHAAEMILVCER